MKLRLAIFVVTIAAAIGIVPVAAQNPSSRQESSRIPLVAGLTVRMTLHIPGGVGGCASRYCDRDDLVTLDDVSATGVKYLWQYVLSTPEGDIVRHDFRTFVRRVDLADAARWREFLGGFGVRSADHPGYTAFSVSTSVHDQLATSGSASFAIMAGDITQLSAALAQVRGPRVTPVLWRGTLTRISSATEPFPLIVNGRRVTVPALHIQGKFTATRHPQWEPEMWVLAESAHPIFLKVKAGADHVWQAVSVDTPAGDRNALERTLLASCRVELPGIYFGFNSVALYPSSDRAIAMIAGLLDRHSDWDVTIEGHTDSIGSEASNKTLSQQRSQIVRDRLVAQHRIDARRVHAIGFGESVPRESNATVEGRARNRRVELVRKCGERRS
jgi:outer membrane protein OmpA-like peptidoglycan-associated protein